MRAFVKVTYLLLCLAFGARLRADGPYAPAPGVVGSTAVSADDPQVLGWATAVVHFEPGPVDISVPGSVPADFGTPESALGMADATPTDPIDVVSLGDAGSITLSFDFPIANGPGPDFAVFENGFMDGFVELAFVEVSSDGASFLRFPAISLTQIGTPVGSFGLLEATELHNLAGKYRAGFGTPFDLEELVGGPMEGIDLSKIRFVRIIDVVGTLDPSLGSTDSRGVPINDPFPTPFPSSGFDLDAVAVLNRRQPMPSLSEWMEANGGSPMTITVAENEVVYELEVPAHFEDVAIDVLLSPDLVSWRIVEEEEIEKREDRWFVRCPRTSRDLYGRLHVRG